MPPRKGKEKANEQSKNKADPKTVTFGATTDMESDHANKPKRLSDEEKLAWASQMIELFTEKALEEGIEKKECEGVGDCWAIAIMAGDDREIPFNVIEGFNDSQRHEYITKMRKKIYELLTQPDEQGGTSLKLKEVIRLARFSGFNGMPREPEGPEDRCARAYIEAIKSHLKPWLEPKYYGDNQCIIMAALGFRVKRSVITIGAPGVAMPATGKMKLFPACFILSDLTNLHRSILIRSILCQLFAGRYEQNHLLRRGENA
jgi:hypothetical protein